MRTVYTGERVANRTGSSSISPTPPPRQVLVEQVRNLQSRNHPYGACGISRTRHDACVLELVGTPRYSAFQLYSPYRLVIDVEPVPPAAVDVLATLPPPVMTPAPKPVVAAPTLHAYAHVKPVSGACADSDTNVDAHAAATRECGPGAHADSALEHGARRLLTRAPARPPRLEGRDRPGPWGPRPPARFSNGVTESELVLGSARCGWRSCCSRFPA
jgi:hypothetical protein